MELNHRQLLANFCEPIPLFQSTLAACAMQPQFPENYFHDIWDNIVLVCVHFQISLSYLQI